MARQLLCLFACAGIGTHATGTEVYKCSDRSGHVAYQDTPCTGTQRQQTLRLPDAAATPAPAPVEPMTAATPDDPPAPPPAVPGTPLTQLYACRHAVDGKTYLSRDGQPQPFLAPLGMLGVIQQPLSQVYGQPGGAGISAPEANRGRITPGLVANNYVWVQDQCRPLSVPEICQALRHDLEQNERKLQRAFKSDRPPLQQRDDELRAQLTNC